MYSSLDYKEKREQFLQYRMWGKRLLLEKKILFKTFVGNRTYFFPTIYNGFFNFGQSFALCLPEKCDLNTYKGTILWKNIGLNSPDFKKKITRF